MYLGIAAVLEVDPGRLLGPDEVQLEATESEMTLVSFVRLSGTEPAAAIAVLAAAGRG